MTVLGYPWTDDSGRLHQDNITVAQGPHFKETVHFSLGAFTGQMTTRPSLNCLEQDDQELVAWVRENLLQGPAPGPYNFTYHSQDFSQFGDGQAAMLDQRYFYEQKKGSLNKIGFNFDWAI